MELELERTRRRTSSALTLGGVLAVSIFLIEIAFVLVHSSLNLGASEALFAAGLFALLVSLALYFLLLRPLTSENAERKKAEAAARAGEVRYAVLAEAAQDVIFTVDRDLRFEYVNQFGAGLLRKSPKDVLGRNFADLFPPLVAARQAARALQVFESGRPAYDELLVPHADVELWMGVRLSPIRDETGAVRSVLGMARNITERKQADEALRASEAMLNEVGRMAQVGGWSIDIAMGSLTWTKEVYAIHEVDETFEPTVESAVGFYTPEWRPVIEAAVQQAIDVGEPFNLEMELITAKGRRVWVHALGAAHPEEGPAKMVSGVFQDITERKRAEEALQQAADRYENVTNTTMDAFWAADLEGRILEANEASLQMYGYSREEMLALHIGDLDADESPEVMREHQRQIATQGEDRFEARHRRKDGTIFEVEVSARAWAPEGLTGSFIRDISERKRAETALRVQARTDELTKLPNRRAFVEEVEGSLAESSPRVALLILDLDRFKEINDSLGHSAGDRLLETIGARLTGALRPGDILARLSGDEFGVLVRGGTLVESRVIASRLQDTLSQPVRLQGMLLPVSASIGIALAPEHGLRTEDLFAHADIAMYRAKRLHTRMEVFDSSEGDHNLDRLEFQAAFHTALEGEELVLHYQPKVDLENGRAVGVEALIRWERPEYGLVFPDRFLPLAQETGMMSRITSFVLHQALRDCRAWQDRGHDLSVSVNIPASHLVDGDLQGTVTSLLKSEGLSPECLVVEVTEDTFMGDDARSVEVLGRLRGAGVRISIDDYGTGFTSLAYLRDLPIDELKLDRTFIGDLLRSPVHEAIVASTIGLAHMLGLEVVAEGIEDTVVYERLREIGCDLGQGYHILRPAPLDHLLAYLEESRSLTAIPGLSRIRAVKKPSADPARFALVRAYRRSGT